ncbi:hypothetical protein JJB07_17085 [Tumebacillus sp. ITR2]|uniref:Uncharacterized protein n=1 Tax=Tumebacillus amylolyticus TaxID=2801339 RepID=A0ABS1JDF5_9BACL|nr:DUF6516 family protein [Tumebacillus amylolyticus]MBL0388322.1 hypothetical protein [Tumebacillus amylolyticus]
MADIEQDPSNFLFLETMFLDIIDNVRETDSTGMGSSFICARKTYILKNNTKLFVTEHYTKEGKIDHFYYDWVTNEKASRGILSFHSESHEEKAYRTSTEPFHIHTHEDTKLSNVSRLPNYNFHDLFSVLEYIRLFIYANQVLSQ